MQQKGRKLNSVAALQTKQTCRKEQKCFRICRSSNCCLQRLYARLACRLAALILLEWTRHGLYNADRADDLTSILIQLAGSIQASESFRQRLVTRNELFQSCVVVQAGGGPFLMFFHAM